ncbi:2OG-Fe(II) oxygenase, partial [Phenylobacterium sp.]|uniref:2OG-Fe(II) oxygenase n=1 Tax=Phenylobacterium sp. TaxID=1871053 RepID=UPI003562E9E5
LGPRWRARQAGVVSPLTLHYRDILGPRWRARQAGVVSPLTLYDNLLKPPEQAAIWAFLNRPGWAHGGYSADGSEADRYFYKHYAGYPRDGGEPLSDGQIEDQLAESAPILAQLWGLLKGGPLKGHALTRCYANAMQGGTEGGLHLDSTVEDHMTAIYYAHPEWTPDQAGETLLFNTAGDEVVAAIYPRPNRLAVFPGTIPHVARPMSRRASGLRITLMFKTRPAGEPRDPAAPA